MSRQLPRFSRYGLMASVRSAGKIWLICPRPVRIFISNFIGMKQKSASTNLRTTLRDQTTMMKNRALVVLDWVQQHQGLAEGRGNFEDSEAAGGLRWRQPAVRGYLQYTAEGYCFVALIIKRWLTQDRAAHIDEASYYGIRETSIISMSYPI